MYIKSKARTCPTGSLKCFFEEHSNYHSVVTTTASKILTRLFNISKTFYKEFFLIFFKVYKAMKLSEIAGLHSIITLSL
jgi:hypothetical protein